MKTYTVRNIMLTALLAVLSLVAIPAVAQRNDKIYNRPYADQKRWHLGFSVGMHFQDLKFTHNGFITDDGKQWGMEVPELSPGFCVNVLADLRLHKYFNLRFSPGMYFGGKNVQMYDTATGASERQSLKTAYIVAPIDLKISGERFRNSRPYVTVGAMGSFDVGKKRSDFLKFKPLDAFLTVGLGCDFYLPFFKLNPEIKFCFGLTNILQKKRPDLVDNPSAMEMTKSLDKVKSNMVVLTFYFE